VRTISGKLTTGVFPAQRVYKQAKITRVLSDL
jgi:hypothetical protein